MSEEPPPGGLADSWFARSFGRLLPRDRPSRPNAPRRAPVLVSAPQGWRGLPVVRELRVLVDDDRVLVVAHPGGRHRTVAAAGTVSRVLWVDDLELQAMLGVASPLVVFLGSSEVVLTLVAEDWNPTPTFVDGPDLRSVSGLNAVASALGLAIEPADEASRTWLHREERAVRSALLRPEARVPPWGVAGQVGCVLAVLVVGAALLWFSAPWRDTEGRFLMPLWLGAPLALVVLLAALGVVVLRADGRRLARHPTREPSVREVRPAPATAVPRRFLTTARLRIGPNWVVLCDAYGREAWLPGPALGGVTTAAIAADAVVLDDAEGRGWASLDMAAWCGQPRTLDQLTSALEAAGITARHEPSTRRPGGWFANATSSLPPDVTSARWAPRGISAGDMLRPLAAAPLVAIATWGTVAGWISVVAFATVLFDCVRELVALARARQRVVPSGRPR